MKKILSSLISASILISVIPSALAEKNTDAQISEAAPVYLDTTRSFEERAADLVSRMTLEEKAAQLGYTAPAIERLGVSAYNYWKECLHGVARQGKATNYPASLALSNTWDAELIHRIADETSTEARAKNSRYNLSYYTPTINMARDPRWGRNEETYGEDPYLTGVLGAEFVRGMQGDDDKYTKIIATIKHFAANNNEKNRRGGSSVMSEYNFRNYYTKVFQNVSERVMPGSVMSSYNATTVSRNGEYIYNFRPSSSNPYLLTDLLRRNWGFDGYVTTDCGAGNDLASVSQYKIGALGSDSLPTEAYVAEALKSGMDLECNLSGGNTSAAYAAKAVEEGYMTEEELETAVYHLFLQRFRTGEFDDNAAYRSYSAQDIESEEHIATAEKAAEESWVLLKNDDILPLKNDVKKVAVVGDLADKLVLGDYTGTPEKTVTPIDGLRAELGAEVTHVGAVSDTTPLYNIKSITLVKSNGSETKLDLSKAKGVSGMNSDFTEVTSKAAAYFENVNFENVVKVKAEMATGTYWGGSLNIAYGQGGPTVAAVSSEKTADTNTYAVCEGEYTGADGGYNGTVNMYISASAAARDFSVSEFRTELDDADVIIAYAGTIPKQDGFGASDSSESNDRASIDLPAHQSHVQPICDAYPDKTVVVMSTVGQINVEPFADKCRAILWTSYNGQVQGTALGRVLTGDANPSGRLTTTWYKAADVEKMELFNNTEQTIGGIKGKFTDYNIQAEGKNPGHTYMYYSGEAVYPFGFGLSYTDFTYSDISIDKTEADANDTVKVSVKVKNTGTKDGAEVVQLYAVHPQTGGQTPKKQLKGFKRVELAAGEEQTVEFELSLRDMALYDEAAQRTIVPTGAYTLYAAKNADDEANPVQLNVSGTLDAKLKTVKAMPNGISVKGLICDDGTGLEAKTAIDPRVSAVLSDERVMSGFDVTLTSSDNDIAAIRDGRVVSGAKAGTAVITASVTINGVTKTDSFPVVNVLALKPTEAQIKDACEQLEAAYSAYPEAAYTKESYAALTKLYNDASSAAQNAESKDGLDALLEDALKAMAQVRLDGLSESYTLASENKSILVNGVIDYREGGIKPYSGGAGTVTNAAPASVQLKAYDEGGTELTGLLWQVQKLDASSRKNAEIDSGTGVLTVYGNGVVEITAADLAGLKCARQVVHINMQIEGEYADNGNGANLADVKSGASNGLNVGSSSKYWVEYKGVKLDMLESITARYSIKNNSADINISLDKSTASDKLIAHTTVDATGSWSSWKDTEVMEVNTDAVNKAELDENGCATLYIQTNGANLDYFRLNYTEYNDDVPYVIEKVTNKNDGAVSVVLKYRGSIEPSDAELCADIAGRDTVKETVKGSGEYLINAGASNGDVLTLTVRDSNKTLSEDIEHTYRIPAESEVIAYYLDSPDYDYTVFTGGEDGVKYSAEVNGLSGYGAWVLKGKKSSYTYTDVNDKSYTYSFTNTWQGGRGNTTSKNLFFTPKSEGKVTVVFNGAVGRDMYIYQNGKTVTGTATGDDVAFSMDITDTENPIYVYGAGSNKNLYAMIVEYYGKTEQPTVKPTEAPTAKPTEQPTAKPTEAPTETPTANPTEAPTANPTEQPTTKPTAVPDTREFVKITAEYDADGRLTDMRSETISEITDEENTELKKVFYWESLDSMKPFEPLGEPYEYRAVNADVEVMQTSWLSENDVTLTKNPATGETKVWQTVIGSQKVQLPTDTFAYDDTGYKYGDTLTINSIASYKDRVYAGCDGGKAVVFTACSKCYQLRSVCDFDIKTMEIENGLMTVSDGINEKTVDMSQLGADTIGAGEALELYSRGAKLIDVRSEAEFAEKSYAGSVNIPLAELDAALGGYDADDVLIFYCASGGRAAQALSRAKAMGFVNVYNLGSIDEIL